VSIVVVGSIAFDTVETPFGKRERALGGAANFFSLAASFFTRVRLVGVVGLDFPDSHLEFLKTRGVDIDGVEKKAGNTFHWSGRYTYDLSNPQTLRTELNVFSAFSPALPAHFLNSESVFLANIDPDLQLNVLEQMRSPKIKALDTMNFWIEGKNTALKKAISQVDILLINEGEARQLSGEHNIVKAARALQRMGPHQVVIKRGEYGALLFNEDVFFAPAFPLEDVFDPTGAGDTFAGGFLGWLDRCSDLSPKNLRDAMIMGCVMSSYVIEDFSFDRLKTLTMEDIEKRFKAMKTLVAS
jgi:sugar/nucleoside kinase (ribokinase family)